MNVGKKIQELRDSRKLTQKELADIIGIARSTLANYERGKHDVPLELIPVIAKFFGVTTDYLFDLEV